MSTSHLCLLNCPFPTIIMPVVHGLHLANIYCIKIQSTVYFSMSFPIPSYKLFFFWPLSAPMCLLFASVVTSSVIVIVGKIYDWWNRILILRHDDAEPTRGRLAN